MGKMFKKVAVGGTFDRLHKGHKALIEKAFEIGDVVIIGLSSDEMVKKGAEPYETRKRVLLDFLKKFEGRYEVVKLGDAYGPATEDKDIEAIVVSRETEPRAYEINRVRERNNIKGLKIIVVPFALAEDGKPISSTRIRKGEINTEGKKLNTMPQMKV
jgi:pantetheine-phosphate adenylyltransferase